MTATEIDRLLVQIGESATLIETHISWVILVDEWAYKIKKPLQFSFLDFSTLALRRQACTQELMLNRRLAPTVYLSVVAIVQHGDSIVLTDDRSDTANAIDYAVKMSRLDTDLEMDKLLARGLISPEYMRTLAAKIAKFHANAAIVQNRSQSDPEVYRRDFNDILQHVPTFVACLGADAQTRLERVVKISDRFLGNPEYSALIRKRLDDGFVRDVHGDLHTRNIFAYPEPVVFDCIEFNDHFRQIDVLNEVAFFCMDLEEQGHEDLARIFIESYAAAIPALATPQAERLFVWFKCYRANIRAKVNALRAAQATHPIDSAHEMEAYLNQTERYATLLVDSQSL